MRHTLLLFLLFLSGQAFAQDNRCSDILTRGIFQTAQYRENTYFQQIIWSRFVSSTFASSKSDKAAGFGVPVGEIVLGGNYDEQTYNHKKADIRREMSNTVTTTNEIDVALASGDPVVVGAWKECMKSRGGQLFLRLSPVSRTQAFAEIEWYPGLAGSPTAVESVEIDEDIVLPAGITFASGAGCFKRKKKISWGVGPCRATINLPNAAIDLALSVNSSHGSAAAYLPPRLVLQRETMAFQFTPADTITSTAHREEKRVGGEVLLTQAQINEGWRFVPSSAVATVEQIYMRHWVHKCDSPQVDASSYAFRYSFRMFASGRNRPERNITISCRVRPSILMTREKWV